MNVDATPIASPATALPRPVARLAGWTLTGLFAAFMAFDIGLKLLRLPVVDETLAGLGWPTGAGFGIGLLEALLLVLYLVPRTAVLGAVLFTGLLGGAIATHLRLGQPLLSHTLFGVYLGVFAWGGLWLRDARLRALLPWRQQRAPGSVE